MAWFNFGQRHHGALSPLINDKSGMFRINKKNASGRHIEQLLIRRTDEAFAYAKRIHEAKKSMLAIETLAVLHKLAAESTGPIIEIGAYVGGATLALLHATRERGNTVVSVEFGVAYDHPEVPTEDSVADLRNNVESWGLAGQRHVILPGWSLEAWLVGGILIELTGNRADMLIIDSDGFSDRDFLYLHPLLNDGAFLVFDDYLSSMAAGKSERIAPFVDNMVERGVLREIALLPWGTWFGQLARRPQKKEIAAYHNKWKEESWPWLDFLAEQRSTQHLPRAKDMKVKLLPFQFKNQDVGVGDKKQNYEISAYKKVRSKE